MKINSVETKGLDKKVFTVAWSMGIYKKDIMTDDLRRYREILLSKTRGLISCYFSK